MACRHLIFLLGDQLDPRSAAFDGFDPGADAILQAEVLEEATYVPQHQLRLAFFFSAMRHFCEAQRALGRRVIYRNLDDPQNSHSLQQELLRTFQIERPQRIIVLAPGDWRVRHHLQRLELPIEFRDDRHFLCSPGEFSEYVKNHPRLLLEEFYRRMRRRMRILLEPDGSPMGGAWNFDSENRRRFDSRRAPPLPPIPQFSPDAITRDVLAMVRRQFPDNPGSCQSFSLPVTRQHALAALNDFTLRRLPSFGPYQDAMQSGQPFLFHSHLSGLLNLHLLSTREVLDQVLANPASAPLNSIEGFVRQLIGWREFVRGVYWHFMPEYAQENALGADLPMPRFYWTGETQMRCLAQAIQHTLEFAYAHHIERLMVLGLFCLLLGVRPYDVHRWHLSMFWDAIDWVSLPNVIGMSQHADNGRMATKPYVASGHYINRMSNHCRHCRYDPKLAVGENACPFTTLYWDFLARHAQRFESHPRMLYAYRNVRRKSPAELKAIREQAQVLRDRVTAETFL